MKRTVVEQKKEPLVSDKEISMSVESELDIEIDQNAIEAGKQVTVLTMTSNELIGHLWDICNDYTKMNRNRSDYKKMIVDELKLRMIAHTL